MKHLKTAARVACEALFYVALFFAVGLLFAAMLAAEANAQHCNTTVRTFGHHYGRVAVVKQQVVASPVILYQAGGYLYVDAQIRRIAKEAAKEGAAEALNQLAAELEQSEAAGSQPVELAPAVSPVANVASYLESKCLSCHNGPGSPKGVDLSSPDALTLFRAADSVREGRMPKGEKTPDPEAAKLLSEAARLSLAK